jgi:hypothetical protein
MRNCIDDYANIHHGLPRQAYNAKPRRPQLLDRRRIVRSENRSVYTPMSKLHDPSESHKVLQASASQRLFSTAVYSTVAKSSSPSKVQVELLAFVTSRNDSTDYRMVQIDLLNKLPSVAVAGLIRFSNLMTSLYRPPRPRMASRATSSASRPSARYKEALVSAAFTMTVSIPFSSFAPLRPLPRATGLDLIPAERCDSASETNVSV